VGFLYLGAGSVLVVVVVVGVVLLIYGFYYRCGLHCCFMGSWLDAYLCLTEAVC